MFFYHVPDPDEAMLISGRKQSRQKGAAEDSEALPFKIVIGNGALVLPVLNSVSFLTLAMQEAEVSEPCYTKQGITVGVHAVIAFKVGNDTESIAAAARRFLGDQSNNQMQALVGRIFAGHLRSIVGSMTVEAIIQNQQELGDNILSASKPEMAKMGLVVDSLQISQIDDANSGYIDAMSAPHRAAVQQAAQIAQAQAKQAAAQAEQESAKAQAEYQRNTAVAQAQFLSETEAAQQKAAQAGPLAQAQAQQEVYEQQAVLAEKQAELTEQQLKSTVVKPAEAEAQRVRVAAQASADQVKLAATADAQAIKVKAEAAATEGRISLDQLLIEELPSIVTAAAQGLSGANLTVLNGTEGVTDLFTQLVSQGMGVLNTIKAGLPAETPEA